MPTLYIGNLPKDYFYDLDLYKFFTNKGYKVKSAKICVDKKSGRHLQYGYINFFADEEAERCLKEMNNATI